MRPNRSSVSCTASIGVVRLGDVGLHRNGVTAQMRDAVDDLIQAVPATGDQGHCRAFLGEAARGRGTDATAGARDEGYGSAQSFVKHGCLISSTRAAGQRSCECRCSQLERRERV